MLLPTYVKRGSQPPPEEPPFEDWWKFVSLLEALGRALDLSFPPTVVMDLVPMEMKILGVQIFDSTMVSNSKVWPWSPPKDYAELSQLARDLWTGVPAKSDNKEMIRIVWPRNNWVPSPTSLAIRKKQKRQSLASFKRMSNLKLWFSELSQALTKNIFSDLKW
jgi:hypothetical protein